jgi:O-acetyl-ADP-ribose deacetylase
MLEKKINDSVLQIEKGDLTAMEIEGIVFYASHDLKLGSGFGSAISARGGMSIQEELNSLGTISTSEAVITGAGQLNSNFIVHAVGPRFQETDTEGKLRTTMENALKAAEKKGIKEIAFPPMGSGFYGVSLEMCSKVMIDVIKEKLENSSSIKKVIICVLDNREYKAFEANWKNIN